MTNRAVTRDISYASSASSRSGRALIRLMENATGRPRLIRRARGYEQEVAAGRNFWEVMAARYGLGVNLRGGGLEAIPASGPLIVVANHPFGILDGLVMGLILARRRSDFKVLAHRIFANAPDLAPVILPVSFEPTREAIARNIAMRAEALRYLRGGGAVGVFPGGTVSTSARPFGRAMDPGWRSFTARMVAKSGATVVPVFFEGENSRLFQIASHLHPTLRMGLLIREFRTRVGRDVNLVVGSPIAPETLAAHRSDAQSMMDLLRRATYDLSPEPMTSAALGYEFEENHRKRHGSRDF